MLPTLMPLLIFTLPGHAVLPWEPPGVPRQPEAFHLPGGQLDAGEAHGFGAEPTEHPSRDRQSNW